MINRKHVLVVTVLFFLIGIFFPGQVSAGTAGVNDDGVVKWQAGVDGIELDWNSSGEVIRIVSRQSTPVEFPDRRGISKAQIIAEEKAKAGIIRFLNQSLSSTRVVAEIQSDINKATQLRNTGQSPNIQKTDERVLIESLSEVTTSFSSGELKGVIVLERGYEEKLEEAWVVVGISEKTINARNSTDRMLKESPNQNDPTRTDGIKMQESEIRKSKQNDW